MKGIGKNRHEDAYCGGDQRFRDGRCHHRKSGTLLCSQMTKSLQYPYYGTEQSDKRGGGCHNREQRQSFGRDPNRVADGSPEDLTVNAARSLDIGRDHRHFGDIAALPRIESAQRVNLEVEALLQQAITVDEYPQYTDKVEGEQ